MNVRLPLIALLACTSLACNLSDPNAPLGERPVQGQSCSEVGDTFGNLADLESQQRRTCGSSRTACSKELRHERRKLQSLFHFGME